jgi:hypothetical protein
VKKKMFGGELKHKSLKSQKLFLKDFVNSIWTFKFFEFIKINFYKYSINELLCLQVYRIRTFLLINIFNIVQ